jgi:pimeloyl-ACP methyl ester carboxylesterase
MRANWPVRAGLARKNGVASLIPMLEKVFFTQASLDEDGPNVRHVKEKWATCSGEGYALGSEWLAMLDAREQAKRMRMPTSILLGSNEGQPFKDAAKWMNESIPGSRGVVEVPMAGHASVRERPAFVLQEFRRFLS